MRQGLMRRRSEVSGTKMALLGAAFLLAALNLRPAIAAVSPILPIIRSADGLSPVAAGLLTTMPLVCFGGFAFAAPWIVRRTGASGLLLGCLLGLLGGIVVRSLPGTVALFAGTLVVGTSVGICNVLMPGVVKKDFPRHVALMTGLYTMMLSGGPSVGAGVSVPLDHGFGGSWRLALGFWAIPVAISVVCWLPFRRHDPPLDLDDKLAPAPASGHWRSSVAWSLTLYMGLQSLNFYTVLAWLPTILQSRGSSVAGSGTLLALLNLVAIGASLLSPALSVRLGSQRPLIVAAAAANGAGIAGLLLDGHRLQLLWAVMIGLGQGSAVSLAFMMMVVRAADSGHATALSGMAQGIGYLMASTGPVAAGAVFGLSGGWTGPLVALFALLPAQVAAGWRAGGGSSRGEEAGVATLGPEL